MKLLPWTERAWYDSAYEEAKRSANLIRDSAAVLLRIYQEGLPGISEAEIGERLRRSNEARIASLPDPGIYPETRGLADLVLAQWRGWRDGAGLNDVLWQARCDTLFYYHREVLRHPKPSAGKCTYVYFPESDRGPLLGNNLDSGLDEPVGPASWPGVNDHLFFGTVSSGVFLDEVSPEIFPLPLHRMLGRFCSTTREGVELLQRYVLFWGPCNALMVDREHSVAMIEKSSCRMGVRHSTGYGFITAMTAEEPTFRAYLDDRRVASLKERNLDHTAPDCVYWAETDHRRKLLAELIREAQKDPTFETLRGILQYRGDRGRVCYDGDDLGGTPAEYTLSTTIWSLKDPKAVRWVRSGDIPSFLAKPETTTFSL